MTISRRGRGRILAAAVASGALAAAATTTITGPAQSAPPKEDCARPFPVAEVVKGQPVTGLTVSSGTTPEEFTGEVLGVVRDGIAPGLDMVMAELSNPAVDEAGIWQGMSGSPVYAEDGRLIGAVAYGLSWGPSPVAGITPFEEMDDYLSAPAPETVRVSKAQARTIARVSDASTAEAREGFEQLPMPMASSGAHRFRRDLSRQQRKYLVPRSGGTIGTAPVTAGEESLVAGGNLAATISHGDLTLAGVGTVTSVCGGEVIGFGHPMTFGGRTSMGLSPADAVFVQEDPVGPGFKVANVGAPVGTIDNDRLTGISGPLGAVPQATDVDTAVTMDDRSRSLLSHASDADYTADVVFSQALANHDRVVDAITEGSAALSYVATGTDARGRDFTVRIADRYQSDYDVSFEAIWDAADVSWLLGTMPGVTVDDVSLRSAVTDDASTYRLRQVQVRKGRTWRTLERRSVVRARAGKVLRVRARLVGPDDARFVRLSVRVPRRAAGTRARLQVVGGGSDWTSYWGAKSPQELARALRSGPRNDQVQLRLDLAKRRFADRRDESAVQSRVVLGQRTAAVRIVR